MCSRRPPHDLGTGYMLGITTGLCLQVAALFAERRRTRRNLAALVQNGTLQVADRYGAPLSAEQLVSALDLAIGPAPPANARRHAALLIVAAIIAAVTAATALSLIAREP